jgi:hypothetical protein
MRRSSDSTSSTGRPLASPAAPSNSRQRRIERGDGIAAVSQPVKFGRVRPNIGLMMNALARTVKMVFVGVFLAAGIALGGELAAVGALMSAACFLGAVA